jgi:hypothetical protein
MRFRTWMLVPLVLLAAGGFGCGSWSLPNLPASSSSTDAGSATSTAVQQANAIQFLPGDSFEVRQTVLGFGAFLPDLLKTDDGVRMVTIQRFAPTHLAELNWQVTATTETDASKRARADYEANLKAHPVPIGQPLPPPPNVEMAQQTTTGTLLGINLRASHSAYLPLYWKQGKDDIVGEKTGVWMGDDAFMELVNTRQTILNLGIFDDAVNSAAKNISGLKDAYAAMREQANQDAKFSDLTLLQADPEFIEWPISVNGVTENVSAIKAHNWFGEVIVLNNRQNPLILKVTLNPTTSLASALGTGTSLVQNLFGYEVKNITLHR